MRDANVWNYNSLMVQPGANRQTIACKNPGSQAMRVDILLTPNAALKQLGKRGLGRKVEVINNKLGGKRNVRVLWSNGLLTAECFSSIHFPIRSPS
jgi:hypothetical protein